MTHISPGDTAAGAASAMLTTPPDASQAPAPPHRHLDRDHLRSGVMARRLRLADLEAAIAAACEKAAARGAARSVRIDDRATWDRAMWQRYLDAAARLEPHYGPAMRRLYLEIDQLERLIALPVAA